MIRIPGLQKYRNRKPNGRFEDLPYEIRSKAQMWLWRFCQRWGNDLPQWRIAILVGQAKRLALNPPDSSWGRKMRARKGGLTAQRHYFWEGINPTEKATATRVEKARLAKESQVGKSGLQSKSLPL